MAAWLPVKTGDCEDRMIVKTGDCQRPHDCRRRENLVGANQVLAEYHDEHLYHDIYDNHV